MFTPARRKIVTTAFLPSVKLRVTVTIEIDAADYLEAAGHQKRLEGCLNPIKQEYPEAAIAVTERRLRRSQIVQQLRSIGVHSGKLRVYD
jgi:hypothetical protein